MFLTARGPVGKCFVKRFPFCLYFVLCQHVNKDAHARHNMGAPDFCLQHFLQPRSYFQTCGSFLFFMIAFYSLTALL